MTIGMIEIRSAPAGASTDLVNDRIITGWPIMFNTLSVDLGGFRERILPQAVDRSLKADVRALVDHDTAKVIGRTRSGTMKLRKETKGLKVTIEPDPEITYAGDIMRAVGRGDVSGMSFAFKVLEEDWHEKKGEPAIRDILDMEVSEVSIVTFPAYTDTDVSVAKRALDLYREQREYQWRQKWHEINVIRYS